MVHRSSYSNWVYFLVGQAFGWIPADTRRIDDLDLDT